MDATSFLILSVENMMIAANSITKTIITSLLMAILP
jgi:hypothetical protein